MTCWKILIPAFSLLSRFSPTSLACLVILHPSTRLRLSLEYLCRRLCAIFICNPPPSRFGIRDIGTIDALELSLHICLTAMRAPVTVAPVFQDAGNVHAAPARRSATSIDTTDWRGCGDYDASYSTCHNSFVLQTLMRCLTKYSVEIHAHSTGTGVPAGAVLRHIRPVFRLYPIHRRNRSHDLC